MEKDDNDSARAVTPLQLAVWSLFMLFLGLKLGGAIAWSWWWVTAPLWIPAALVVLVLLAALVVVLCRMKREPKS